MSSLLIFNVLFICIIVEVNGNPIKKMNALVILADDGGFEMGAYRNKICQTPNLDRLAKDSLIFNKAFTSVSSCSPSRASLLTGMPSHQNGMYGLHQGINNFDSFESVQSLPKILKQHGIKTGIIGKKHVGPEDIYPFDFSETEENNSILQVGRNITHIKLLTRKFLENSSSPFFLYVAFHDPHRCGHTNPEYGEFCQRFGNGETGMGHIPDWQPIYYQPGDLELPYFIPNTWESRKDVAAQYTTISRLDQGVGLILRELQNSGHADDTLIIYTSDNGIPFPNGRTNLYESGIAEPMFISSPLRKERRGQVTNSLASLLDIVPTLIDWFDIGKNKGNTDDSFGRILTGKSLLPLLIKEPADKSKEAIFGSHNLHEVTMYYPMRMVRTQRYKLIHNINYYAPFPIDQDLFLSPTFQSYASIVYHMFPTIYTRLNEIVKSTMSKYPSHQIFPPCGKYEEKSDRKQLLPLLNLPPPALVKDILNRTLSHQDLRWFKTLQLYYKRPEWEMFDLKHDPEELNNIVKKNSSQIIYENLKKNLFDWQMKTNDPWICSPHAVLEDKGYFKNSPRCLYLDNISFQEN